LPLGTSNRLDQGVVPERFFDEIERAGPERCNSAGNCCVSGDEDRRNAPPSLVKLLLQFETRHMRHANVKQEASALLDIKGVEKRNCRRKRLDGVPRGTQQEAQAATHALVIVDDKNRPFTHTGAPPTHPSAASPQIWSRRHETLGASCRHEPR